MNNKRYSGYIIAAVLGLLVLYTIITYNGLVAKEELVKKQWNEVNSAYQRRVDLIPNLVNVVKGQANFEQNVLVEVTEARAKASSVNVDAGEITADNFNKQSAAQNELAVAASRLLITVEKYPELKGAAAFAGLQTQLEGTERRIKVARKDFNASIATYNSSVKSFPTNIVGSLMGFKAKEGFQSDVGADKFIDVKFK
jgi:LemA protein